MLSGLSIAASTRARRASIQHRLTPTCPTTRSSETATSSASTCPLARTSGHNDADLLALRRVLGAEGVPDHPVDAGPVVLGGGTYDDPVQLAHRLRLAGPLEPLPQPRGEPGDGQGVDEPAADLGEPAAAYRPEPQPQVDAGARGLR